MNNAFERRGGRGHRRGMTPFGVGPAGPVGGPGMPGGPHRMFSGPGPGRGHRARRGDVRLAALLLIAEAPRNGYQIIQELESRTDGRWKPSPGAMYPALSQLEDEGLIRAVDSDAGKAYEATDAGREQAAAVAQNRAPWEHTDGGEGHPGGDLAHEYGQLWTAVGTISQTGNADLIEKATAELQELKRKLYRLLADS